MHFGITPKNNHAIHDINFLVRNYCQNLNDTISCNPIPLLTLTSFMRKIVLTLRYDVNKLPKAFTKLEYLS